MKKQYPPPLSKEQLKEIQERRRDDTDVIALLWEVSRLRKTILYADHFERTLGPTGGSVQMVRDTLRKDLDDEACVKEFPRLSPEG